MGIYQLGGSEFVAEACNGPIIGCHISTARNSIYSTRWSIYRLRNNYGSLTLSIFRYSISTISLPLINIIFNQRIQSFKEFWFRELIYFCLLLLFIYIDGHNNQEHWPLQKHYERITDVKYFVSSLRRMLRSKKTFWYCKLN